MKLVFPGVYKQVESIGLKTVTCACGCVCFGAGMNTEKGYLMMTCLSCGLVTGELYPNITAKDSVEIDEALLLEPGTKGTDYN